MSTVRVRVLDGWTVFDGQQQRGGGEQLDLDPEVDERNLIDVE